MTYTLQNLTPRTSTPSSPFPEPVSEQPCEDQQPQQRGALAEPRRFTGYEPKQIAKDQDYRHFNEDQQLTELEDLRVRPLSFHHPESDFDDEQLRALLASPLYLQERGASAERSQVYHSERENLISSSSQDPISTGQLVAVFSSQNRLNRETFPIERIFC